MEQQEVQDQLQTGEVKGKRTGNREAWKSFRLTVETLQKPALASLNVVDVALCLHTRAKGPAPPRRAGV